jgi:hypothetical protein
VHYGKKKFITYSVLNRCGDKGQLNWLVRRVLRIGMGGCSTLGGSHRPWAVLLCCRLLFSGGARLVYLVIYLWERVKTCERRSVACHLDFYLGYYLVILTRGWFGGFLWVVGSGCVRGSAWSVFYILWLAWVSMIRLIDVFV